MYIQLDEFSNIDRKTEENSKKPNHPTGVIFPQTLLNMKNRFFGECPYTVTLALLPNLIDQQGRLLVLRSSPPGRVKSPSIKYPLKRSDAPIYRSPRPKRVYTIVRLEREHLLDKSSSMKWTTSLLHTSSHWTTLRRRSIARQRGESSDSVEDSTRSVTRTRSLLLYSTE